MTNRKVIDLLIKILPAVAPAIRYADDENRSYWKIHLLIYTILVWIADIILAHLFFSPRKGELTISDTLERTAHESVYHWMLAIEINLESPGHINLLSYQPKKTHHG